MTCMFGIAKHIENGARPASAVSWAQPTWTPALTPASDQALRG
ncbi:MAG TPA: hypothetical protein VI318_26500 [Baekduia sp.]